MVLVHIELQLINTSQIFYNTEVFFVLGADDAARWSSRKRRAAVGRSTGMRPGRWYACGWAPPSRPSNSPSLTDAFKLGGAF